MAGRIIDTPRWLNQDPDEELRMEARVQKSGIAVILLQRDPEHKLMLWDCWLSVGLMANPRADVVSFLLLDLWAGGWCEPRRQYSCRGDKDVCCQCLQIRIVADISP